MNRITRSFLVCFCIVFLSNISVANAASSDSFQLWTKKEQVVDVAAHYPVATTPSPTLIILPGQAYHKDLRLVKSLAENAVKAGYVVLRFDWSFYFNKEKGPSKDLSREREDFAAVLKFARENPRILQNKIYLVGKSLGSIVAARAFAKEKGVRGLVLMTPVMKKFSHGEKFYGALYDDSRPKLLVYGADDKFSPASLVKDYFSQLERFKLLSFPGNHSLNLGKDFGRKAGKFSQANIGLVISHILHWIEYDSKFAQH